MSCRDRLAELLGPGVLRPTLELVAPYCRGEDTPIEDMGCWFVVNRAIRGVRETEEEGRTGEEVGMKRGVEFRGGGEDGAPLCEDMVAV